MSRRLTLIAGSGALAPQVAAAARRHGDSVQVLDLTGRGDLTGDVLRHIPISNAAAIIDAVGAFRSTHLVLAGGVVISDQARQGLAVALGPAGRLARSMGDTALALAFLLHFRLKGVKLLGVHEIVSDLVASQGHIAGPHLTDAQTAAARGALRAARTVGRLDLGQAVVCSGQRPIAAEDVGGTDQLLERVAWLRGQGLVGNGPAPLILAKAMKPGQPSFVDLPAIGPLTIRKAADAGISIVVVQAGRSLLLERQALVAEADARDLAVVGLRYGHV